MQRTNRRSVLTGKTNTKRWLSLLGAMIGIALGGAWVMADEQGDSPGQVRVKVWGNVRHEINGVDRINRSLFGVDAATSANEYQMEYVSKMSDGFSRQWIQMHRLRLPGLEGLSEEAKREKVFSDDYWKALQLERAFPQFVQFQYLASRAPKNVLVDIYGSSPQFRREGADLKAVRDFFDREHPEFYLKTPDRKREIETMMYDYACPPHDKEVYAKVATEVFARVKSLFPKKTRFYVTLWNEPNWPGFFYNQRILDDMVASYLTYGDYRSGRPAIEEYLKIYNPFMTSIKARFPEVLVGGPDNCDPHFVESVGRVQWVDYLKPFLDGAAALDFFDFHYGNDPSTNQGLAEVIWQYTLKTKGKAVPVLDSESGTYPFAHYGNRTGESEAFEGALSNERVWFGYFDQPDKVVGWCHFCIEFLVDGFGRSMPANTGHEVFRNLHGMRVLAQSSNSKVRVVSAVSEDALNAVLMNDNPTTTRCSLSINLPQGASARNVSAEYLWYDSSLKQVRLGHFAPRKAEVSEIDVKIVLPPFATASVSVAMGRRAAPKTALVEKEYPGDNWSFTVAEKSPEVKVHLPASALATKGKEALLRLGYSGNTDKQAEAFVNGEGPIELPPYVPGSTWKYNECRTFPIDIASLRQENVITFASSRKDHPYQVLFASVIVRDAVPAVVEADRRATPGVVVFDIEGSPRPVVAGAPSTTPPRLLISEKPQAPKHLPALRGWWTFDEVEGDVVKDAGSYRNNGTVVGTVKRVPGKLGRALSFDGKSYVRIDDAPSLGFDVDESFALCAWVKPADGQVMSVFSKMESKAINFFLLSDGAPELYINSPEGGLFSQAIGSIKATEGQWHHVAACRDARRRILMVYVDGEYSGMGRDITEGGFRNEKPLHLGTYFWVTPWTPDGFSSYFRGDMDDVRLYGAALTPKQIRLIMKGGDVF